MCFDYYGISVNSNSRNISVSGNQVILNNQGGIEVIDSDNVQVRNNTIKNHNLNVFFNQVLLQRSHETKFLGMQIDENLNWQLHVSHLTRVITVLNGWFFRIRDFIPVQYRRSLYYAYIHSRLSYGICMVQRLLVF